MTLLKALAHHGLMATKTITELIDDLDGSTPADRTVGFVFDGSRYEIDLTEKHADQMHKALSPWLDKARRLGRAPGARRPAQAKARKSERKATTKTAETASNDEIRAWAKSQGLKIADKGRIPVAVSEQFYNS